MANQVLCPIHELVTGQIDETARQPLLFEALSLPTVYRSLPALPAFPAFSALFCLPAFSHVKLQVEHCTVLAKVTGSNSAQTVISLRPYFRNYLTSISSRVFEPLFRSSNTVSQIYLIECPSI